MRRGGESSSEGSTRGQLLRAVALMKPGREKETREHSCLHIYGVAPAPDAASQLCEAAAGEALTAAGHPGCVAKDARMQRP
jgi:hypothetical protein